MQGVNILEVKFKNFPIKYYIITLTTANCRNYKLIAKTLVYFLLYDTIFKLECNYFYYVNNFHITNINKYCTFGY